MSVAIVTPRTWKKPPLIKRAWLRWTLGLGAALYLVLALGTTDVNWHRVWEGLPRGAQFIKAFFPPDFSEVLDVDITVEQAIEYIVSCGVVLPEQQLEAKLIHGQTSDRAAK